MADPCRASARGIGAPRQVNASGLGEGCCVAIRRRGSRFPAYRVAFGAPIRGRDPCPPYPRRQSEIHRPDAPIATEQGPERRPHPRSRASRAQLSPIASGHVVREKPRLLTNPRRKVRTLAPTSGGWKRRRRGGWGTGMMAKPARELSLPRSSAGTPGRAIVETRCGRLCDPFGGISWPAGPLRPDTRSVVAFSRQGCRPCVTRGMRRGHPRLRSSSLRPRALKQSDPSRRDDLIATDSGFREHPLPRSPARTPLPAQIASGRVPCFAACRGLPTVPNRTRFLVCR